MRDRPWILSLWPGLPRLWLQGELSGLLLAVVFAGLLQVALVTSFIWQELVPIELRATTWVTLGCVWLVSAAKSYRNLPYLSGQRYHDSIDALYHEAQTEYLKGNWYQAEALLQRVLREDVGDVDARLMLASLYRHVRRTGEAREQLRQLERFKLARKWQLEIRQEFELLDRLEAERDNGDHQVHTTSDGFVPTTASGSDAA